MFSFLQSFMEQSVLSVWWYHYHVPLLHNPPLLPNKTQQPERRSPSSTSQTAPHTTDTWETTVFPKPIKAPSGHASLQPKIDLQKQSFNRCWGCSYRWWPQLLELPLKPEPSVGGDSLSDTVIGNSETHFSHMYSALTHALPAERHALSFINLSCGTKVAKTSLFSHGHHGR